MHRDDLDDVVRVHRASFRGFFLDRMGPWFLRAYYVSVLEFAGALAHVAVDDRGRVRGFAVGFMEPAAFYQHLRRRRWRLALGIARALIRRPWLLMRVLRSGERVSRIAATETTRASAELASIATDLPGAGIGSMLLRTFISVASARGTRHISLTTDVAGNDRVREFYRHHGFTESTLEHRGDRILAVYRLDLPDGLPEGSRESGC